MWAGLRHVVSDYSGRSQILNGEEIKPRIRRCLLQIRPRLCVSVSLVRDAVVLERTYVLASGHSPQTRTIHHAEISLFRHLFREGIPITPIPHAAYAIGGLQEQSEPSHTLMKIQSTHRLT